MTDPHILGATTLMRDANTLVQRGSLALKQGDIQAAEHFFAIGRERIERAGRVLSRIKDPTLRSEAGKAYAQAVKAWNTLSTDKGGVSGLGNADQDPGLQRLAVLGVGAFVGYKLLQSSVNVGTMLVAAGTAYWLYMKSQEDALPPPPQEAPANTFANIVGQAQKLAASVR